MKYLVMLVMNDETTVKKILTMVDWSTTEFNLFGVVSDAMCSVESVCEVKPHIVLFQTSTNKERVSRFIKIVSEECKHLRVILWQENKGVVCSEKDITGVLENYSVTGDNFLKMLRTAAAQIEEQRINQDDVKCDDIPSYGRSNRLIAKCVDYIQQNYCEDISLNSVAEMLEVSHSYLSRLFKKEMGIPFVCYLTMVRIGKAKKLLMSTNTEIYRVAKSTGYPDFKYFSRIFKKETGFTPKEYREKRRASA